MKHTIAYVLALLASVSAYADGWGADHAGARTGLEVAETETNKLVPQSERPEMPGIFDPTGMGIYNPWMGSEQPMNSYPPLRFMPLPPIPRIHSPPVPVEQDVPGRLFGLNERSTPSGASMRPLA